MKSRSKNEQLPVRRIPVHELFPQPSEPRRMPAPRASSLAGIPPLPKAPQRSAPRARVAKVRIHKTSKGNLAWALVFLGMIVSGFGLFAYTRKSEGQKPYVLLEVRALDTGGHPVTAVDVIVNEKKMGITDSFGEWRRYLQLSPGDDVKIDLNKKDQLAGSRQVEVPRAKSGKQGIEVQVAIAMGKLTRGGESGSVPPAEVQKEIAKVEPKSTIKDPLSIVEDELESVGDQSLGIYFDDGLNSVHITTANQAKSTNVLDKRQQEVLQGRVIPVLANELQNLGLQIDKAAPWKLALAYVPNGNQVGYIRAEIEWQTPVGGLEKTSFIAGFAKTYEETGRALTSLLRLHMKKTYWAAKENGSWVIDETSDTKEFWKLKPGTAVSDTSGEKFTLALAGENGHTRRFKLKIGKAQPCEAVRQRSRCMVSTDSLKEGPPLPGWVQKKVRIQGTMPASAVVYVAGFQAQSLGNNLWEFWGKNGTQLKVLVVSGGRIIHSEAFKDAPGEAAVLKLAQAAGKSRAH